MTVNGREIPGDLPQLLSAGPGSPDGCTQVGRVHVVMRLLNVPIEDTHGLLAIPRETWFGAQGKCFVSGCQGLRDPLERHLRGRFGVGLGALATPAPERPTSATPARAPPPLTIAERAARRRAQAGVIDSPVTPIPERP